MRANAADRAQSTISPYLVGVMAWLVPGLGHLWLGRRQKGVIFLVALSGMFAFGIWLKGRLFPFQLAEPLVSLMAFADLGLGLPHVIARALGVDRGDVVAITYDYGNAFIIVAGLLNMLVVLDAFDIAQGRK
jgi:hypothetical protein